MKIKIYHYNENTMLYNPEEDSLVAFSTMTGRQEAAKELNINEGILYLLETNAIWQYEGWHNITDLNLEFPITDEDRNKLLEVKTEPLVVVLQEPRTVAHPLLDYKEI